MQVPVSLVEVVTVFYGEGDHVELELGALLEHDLHAAPVAHRHACAAERSAQVADDVLLARSQRMQPHAIALEVVTKNEVAAAVVQLVSSTRGLPRLGTQRGDIIAHSRVVLFATREAANPFG
jgi:hypothetical protein